MRSGQADPGLATGRVKGRQHGEDRVARVVIAGLGCDGHVDQSVLLAGPRDGSRGQHLAVPLGLDRAPGRAGRPGPVLGGPPRSGPAVLQGRYPLRRGQPSRPAARCRERAHVPGQVEQRPPRIEAGPRIERQRMGMLAAERHPPRLVPPQGREHRLPTAKAMRLRIDEQVAEHADRRAALADRESRAVAGDHGVPAGDHEVAMGQQVRCVGWIGASPLLVLPHSQRHLGDGVQVGFRRVPDVYRRHPS